MLSTSVLEKSGSTRGQTRMGPLISCFMYDVWHVFEYLHVSEGDANREGKKLGRSSDNSASFVDKESL